MITTNIQDQFKRIEREFDFLIHHLEEPLFPRTISTKAVNGIQIVVNSKEEALARFKEANYQDCRISAFPPYLEHKGKIIQASNFIFVDLDKNQFDDEESLNRALKKCVSKFKDQLDGYPTVLFTGNGYHVYQPIKGIVLEDYSEFNEFDRISQKFLKFGSIFFSNGKSDPNNNSSFKSCLLRVPYSINSKNGKLVEIVERWNGHRPNIKLVMGDFSVYLRKQKIKEDRIRKERERYLPNNTNNNPIPWIETLLQTPIDDYRKTAITLILAPYLLINRQFDHKQTHQIIISWLIKCNKARRLDFNMNKKISEAIDITFEKKIPPMRFETLKVKNKGLYDIINKNIDRKT